MRLLSLVLSSLWLVACSHSHSQGTVRDGASCCETTTTNGSPPVAPGDDTTCTVPCDSGVPKDASADAIETVDAASDADAPEDGAADATDATTDASDPCLARGPLSLAVQFDDSSDSFESGCGTWNTSAPTHGFLGLGIPGADVPDFVVVACDSGARGLGVLQVGSQNFNPDNPMPIEWSLWDDDTRTRGGTGLLHVTSYRFDRPVAEGDLELHDEDGESVGTATFRTCVGDVRDPWGDPDVRALFDR